MQYLLYFSKCEKEKNTFSCKIHTPVSHLIRLIMIIRPLNGSVSLRNCRLTQCQLTYLSANGYRWALTTSAWINKGSVSSGYDCRSEMQPFKIPLHSTEFCTSIRLQRGAVLRTNSLAPFPSGLCSVLAKQFSLVACHANYCGELPLCHWHLLGLLYSGTCLLWSLKLCCAKIVNPWDCLLLYIRWNLLMH